MWEGFRWKAARVPVSKKGSKTLLSKYRPISLVPISNIVMKLVINSKIHEYLRQTKLYMTGNMDYVIKDLLQIFYPTDSGNNPRTTNFK